MAAQFGATARALSKRSSHQFFRQNIIRRNQSSTVTSGPNASSTKSWVEGLLMPFRAYNRALRQRPYRSQLITSLTIYLIGDISAQCIASTAPAKATEEEETKTTYDPLRTMRAMIIGGGSSVPAYRWVLWLGQNFNYSSKVLSLAAKVMVNQLVFTPVFLTYFFGMQSMLSGASLSGIVERIRDGVPVSFINSWKIWPAATAVTMTVVPVHFRNVFVGLVAIGWQTYLSLLNARAARAEAAQHEADALAMAVTHTNGVSATT